MSDLSSFPKQKHAIIALINCDEVVTSMLSHCQLGNRTQIAFKNGIDLLERWEANEWTICAVVSQSEVMAPSGVSLLETLVNKKNITIPFIIICQNINSKILQIALQAGVAEVFKIPFKIDKFETRFNFIVENWEALRRKPDANETARRSYRTPILKRSFDIIFSLIFLVVLSPLLVLVSMLIAFESRGPIFYYSLRVGRGYHIFKFYKFRSMYFDADTRLKDLKHLNQYTTSKKKQKVKEEEDEISYQFLCDECKIAGTKCQYPVYADGVHMCEKQYAEILKHSRESTFIKIKNDPRMTRVGAFIRRTSIDEIPQLWNVLIGDMSIVGNRPLPLYEAEKLTTDKYAMRFMAPAGITGLWQVEKRGSGKMSENDRLILDNIYAKNNSFFNDIILILRTIPAIFQKENV